MPAIESATATLAGHDLYTQVPRVTADLDGRKHGQCGAERPIGTEQSLASECSS